VLTLLAFIFALGLLIAVHEFGHYRMAIACGVKVLKFSVGFGKPILRWQPHSNGTEFVIAMFPLGGYVKMLDEREGAVAPELKSLAFNQQPLRSRALIVAAGPVANLLLAVAIYAWLNWSGVEQTRPILASPVQGSLAEKAGLQGGELVMQYGFEGDELIAIDSFDELRFVLTRAALSLQDIRLILSNPKAIKTESREVVLLLNQLGATELEEDVFQRIGIPGPYTQALIGEVFAGGAAERAGLQSGDRVTQIGLSPVSDGRQLRELIRGSVQGQESTSEIWRVQRHGQPLEIEVTPKAVQEGHHWIGKINAYVGSQPEIAIVRYGVFKSIGLGVKKTWDVSVLTLQMMGKMIVGEASLKNLTGPITIADFAGKSASAGLSHYLVFLALISVSLGVLNLLPIPILDGGHLLYYLWEGLTGKELSEALMHQLQRFGVALLMSMMAVAIFNDLTRLMGL
jgi:regulator of sigma E protease